MKSLKHTISAILALILLVSLYQCGCTQKLQKNAPKGFQDLYYYSWNAGIKEGGSGVNVFIKIKDTHLILDSVYFKGKRAKLQIKHNDSSLYVGRFTFKTDSSDINLLKTPFKLKDNECVISYLDSKKLHYYKISNIEERETINYPSTSTNR